MSWIVVEPLKRKASGAARDPDINYYSHVVED